MNTERKASRLKNTMQMLNRSIYVGERLQANMKVLKHISLFCAVLGLVLIIVNSISGQQVMMIMSVFTFLAGILCWYCVAVLKNRKWSVIIPTVFAGVVFTVYAFTGAGEGASILWSLLVPIGMCYFVSVKSGILLSAYYSVLYAVIFYSPLAHRLSAFYTDKFIIRFPILYISLSVFTWISMLQYHRTALFEIDHTEKLNEEVRKQTSVAEERSRRIEHMSYQTVHTLANAIDSKDPYTKGHSTKVSRYSVLLAEKLGWSQDRIHDLMFAALLHDIGKIGVPDSILSKPRSLTDVEYGIIKSHTVMGGDILREKTFIEKAEEVARSHHERYDGKGYPNGLKGAEISEEARIVALADAFDAMNSDRVFRKAYDREYIMQELISGSGTQFDPDYTDLLISLWNSGELDAILKENKIEEDQEMEASSALLQEVMEAFISESTTNSVDIVTGVLSRTAGETAIAQAVRSESGCLVFFDIDNLKKINDIYGHDAGDKALKYLGEVFRENGKNSICCRLGGDEFLFFIRDASREEAEGRVLKIIREYEKKKEKDKEIAVATLSAGLAMSAPSDPYANVYSKADKALYYVKQNGKNSFSVYSDESRSDNDEPVDLNRLICSIRDSGSYTGAMDVEYRQFAKLYEFVTNLNRRFSQPFRLVMITLDKDGSNLPHSEELETAMYYMEESIRQTIRNVDVLTRYSRQQFLIIFLGSDLEGVNAAVDRIFRGYYKMNGSGAFSPSCAVADPEK